jgi:hypothetical protein
MGAPGRTEKEGPGKSKNTAGLSLCLGPWWQICFLRRNQIQDIQKTREKMALWFKPHLDASCKKGGKQ